MVVAKGGIRMLTRLRVSVSGIEDQPVGFCLACLANMYIYNHVEHPPLFPLYQFVSVNTFNISRSKAETTQGPTHVIH